MKITGSHQPEFRAFWIVLILAEFLGVMSNQADLETAG